MKIKFTEADVDKILKRSNVRKKIKIDSNFVSDVMDRIRNDYSMDTSISVKDIVSQDIYMKFVVGSSMVAAASVLLAFGIIAKSTFTFEEYVIADYILNVL